MALSPKLPKDLKRVTRKSKDISSSTSATRAGNAKAGATGTQDAPKRAATLAPAEVACTQSGGDGGGAGTGRHLFVVAEIVPAALVPAAQAQAEDAHSHAERRAHRDVDQRFPERVEHTHPHNCKVQHRILK